LLLLKYRLDILNDSSSDKVYSDFVKHVKLSLGPIRRPPIINIPIKLNLLSSDTVIYRLVFRNEVYYLLENNFLEEVMTLLNLKFINEFFNNLKV
jgi:hypothetical protein